MGLFDSYFDPQQFQDSGGLLGRLLSLQQQQGQYQPGAGFDPQIPADGQTPFAPQTPPSTPIASSMLPKGGSTAAASQTPDYGQTQNIAVGNYRMPQFGNADVSQAPQQPGLGDRLNAGFQSWAHTPVGNPIAALANGIAGFGTGQRTDPSGFAPAQVQTPGPSLDVGDRLNAGFQSWAHTPVGNPFAAIANGIAGVASGQRSDPASVAQQIQEPRIDPSGNPQQDLHSQYQALRPILGDKNAMLAIVHPEYGKTLIAQALTRPATSATADSVEPDNGPPGPANETNPAASGGQPGFAPAIAARKLPGYSAPPSRIFRNKLASSPRKPKTNFSGASNNGQ